MGKDFKKRNQQHKNYKPYNKNFKNKSANRGNYVPNNDANKSRARKQGYEPKINLKEDQVGITEFTTNGKGFTGVVKARFSDFHVNEIDQNGKVLLLNDLTIPKQIDDELNEADLMSTKKELEDAISPELWALIETLSNLKSSDPAAKPIEIEVTEMSKEKRTQVHKVLKKLYTGKLVSTTVNSAPNNLPDDSIEGKKFIKILKPQGSHDQNRKAWTFPGEYVHFLVHKENMDTSEVAVIIANRLNLRPSQVNYCGTKDKRAKTTQKFCIKRRTPGQIVSSIKYNNNVHIGNFEFSNEVLKLGNLKGNRFRIALRHVSGDNAEIEASLENIKNNGFINYYGLQRFGNCASIPTYEIGIAILKCDYKLACELILKPRDNDLFFMRSIRENWWKNRNSAEAAAMFHNDKFIEKKLLDGLASYGENDYASALRKIPRNMLLLYPHAFQSLIFNRVASRRIKEFGLQLIPGDLVYCNRDDQDIDTVETAPIEEDESETTQETPEEDVATTTDSVYKRKVKALTPEDLESKQYTLFDVVLPIPGYDITLPDNEVGKWYEELLQEQGLSTEKLKHNVKTYAMAGAYRKLLIRPEQMTWEFRTYDTPETTLIASDWELLKGKKVIDENMDTGKFKALIVEFRLPTAVYATMFLRELLKNDTSAASQAQLEESEMKKVENVEDKPEIKEDVETPEVIEVKGKNAGTLAEEVEETKSKEEIVEDVSEAKRARLDDTEKK